MKYHQNIPNGIQVIELSKKCLRTETDTRLIATSPKPFGWGIKKTMHHKSSHIVAKKGNVNLYNMTKILPGSDSLTNDVSFGPR